MKREMIYNIMNGYYEPDVVILCGDIPVENEFEEQKECAQLYEKVYQARIRLAEKLGADEDREVESIINGMNDIARNLAYKMYEYGRKDCGSV